MQNDRTRPLILVVDDDAISASVITEILRDCSDTELVERGALTHERALQLRPDLILLDVLMPETDGYAVCARLKADPRTRDIPVIFVSSLTDEAEEARGLLAGAVDYVIKPISAPVLTARVRNHLELERQRRRLESESLRDDLTGLPNRARLDEALEHEWRRAVRAKEPVSLLAAGIDGLEAFGQMYGARAAADCVRRVATGLARAIRRPADLIARIPPDGFVMLLPATSEAGALVMAEHARTLVRELDVPHAPHGPRASVTISIGLACVLPKPGERAGSTLDSALGRLARARAEGADQLWVDDLAPAGSSVAVANAPSSTQAARLLIVDDDALSVEVLSELLRGAGYGVDKVSDSSAAVAEIQARRPDLVLLDLLMPPPDGFEICRQLKATPNIAEIPVVFLSIVDDPLQKSRAFEVGGADYVGKTFHGEEVLARIRHQLAIRQLQREMREANERLLQASKLKATFAAMLMHDLRSPLGVAQATIDMLVQKMDGLDTELLELAEVAGGGLKNTVALINELLEVYRSEQLQVAPLREHIDLADVLQRVVTDARLEARSRQVALELVLSGRLSTLGDRARLERAFSNLLGNALKHTRAGGKVTVDARAIAGAGAGEPALRVEVRDTGTGIPEGEIPYIFDLYRQAETGRHGGMGLGLAIVKRILDAHGASIAVRSKRGVGSTFSVELSAV